MPQAYSRYLRLHDSLVASQQYKQAYSLAGELAQRAQQTWLYAKAKQNLFPLAQPAYNTGKGNLGSPGGAAHVPLLAPDCDAPYLLSRASAAAGLCCAELCCAFGRL